MENENGEKKLGTRVFKKSSPNNKITIYIGKRDFLDKNGLVEQIDGIVQFDKDYLNDQKLYVHVLSAFHYGREDLDVLGLTFQKDLYLNTIQLYPENPSVNDSDGKVNRDNLSKLQDRLIKKLGVDCVVPFCFQLPHMTPASVSLQPATDHSGKPCGVEYELKVYVSDMKNGTSHKRSSVSLMIRKLTYAEKDLNSSPPSEEMVKDFKISNGKIRIESTLDKSKYFHGESIGVNISIDNTSNKSIKKIRLQVVQISDIMLYSRAVYKSVVDEVESDDAMPISPGNIGWCRSFYLCPLLGNNRNKLGIAVDGKLRYEDTNLASSTVLDDNANLENLGIIVSYKVRVRLILGFGTSDLQMEVPFMLTHPNPDGGSAEMNYQSRLESSVGTVQAASSQKQIDTATLNTHISEEFNNKDDELIFEDFARMRLDKANEAEA